MAKARSGYFLTMRTYRPDRQPGEWTDWGEFAGNADGLPAIARAANMFAQYGSADVAALGLFLWNIDTGAQLVAIKGSHSECWGELSLWLNQDKQTSLRQCIALQCAMLATADE